MQLDVIRGNQQHLRSTDGLRSSRDQGDERHVAAKHEAADAILESRYRAAVGTHLMKVAIRRTQTHSDALISGNQSSSAAIRAHQRHSELISAPGVYLSRHHR